MKRLLLVLLTLVLVLCCLVACKNTAQDADTSDTTQVIVETTDETAAGTEAGTSDSTQETSGETSDETSADTEGETEPLPSINDLTLADYNIVVPNKSPSAFLSVAKNFATGVKDKTGKSIVYMSDVLIGESGPAILLGDTKYPESAQTKALLTEEYSFAIKVFEGGRIAICATENGVLQEAVEYFAEHCISADGKRHGGKIRIGT